MAVNAHMFGQAQYSAWLGLIDWEGGAIKALLTDDSFVPNQDTMQMLSSITGELSGGGYARVTLPSPTAAYDPDTNTTYLSCDPFSFATMTGDYSFMVVFQDSGTASTSPLIGWVDFDGPHSVAAQPVDITPAPEGLFAHQVVV